MIDLYKYKYYSNPASINAAVTGDIRSAVEVGWTVTMASMGDVTSAWEHGDVVLVTSGM